MSKTWRDLLIVDSLINKGTYKTPVIVKVLAGSGSEEKKRNPEFTPPLYPDLPRTKS